MAEKVLNLPLSGAEVREAVLDRINEYLSRDCFLSPNTAYDHFSAKITVHIEAHDVGRTATVEVEVQVTAGEKPENEDEFLEMADAQFDMSPKPPNEVRVESGQPVPVSTVTKGKQEVKGVQYARPGKKTAAVKK